MRLCGRLCGYHVFQRAEFDVSMPANISPHSRSTITFHENPKNSTTELNQTLIDIHCPERGMWAVPVKDQIKNRQGNIQVVTT